MRRKRIPAKQDKIIGQRLRKRRKELGMSQRELGTCIGVSYQQIQKYEKSINRLPASSLYEIANALDVPLEYFFEATTEPMLLISTPLSSALTHQWAAPDRYFSNDKRLVDSENRYELRLL